MKPKYLYIVLSAAVIVFLTFNAFTSEEVNAKGSGHEKVIKFSHKVHSELTDCQSCHSKAATSKKLGQDLYPGHDDCSQCHADEVSNKCDMCHIEENYQAIPYSNPNLIFDHSFHVGQQKMECTKCHQGLEEVDYGYKAKQPFPPMAQCNTCHNNYQGIASNQCENCHITTVNLIPVSHQTVDFKKTHKFDAWKADANCVMCHDNTSCQECHVATNMLTEKNTPTNFYTPYTPSNFQTDGPKKQQITKVHDLNYVYTHGIDLKGGTTECQTCHQVETFCVPCHNDRQADFSLAGVMPASHRVAGFIIPGLGTGGGEHAKDARRDIESCQSCHDTQGNDPVCMRCHIDSHPGKGNDVKTHPSGFMNDIHGDWHNGQGSMCYSCHTYTGVAGVGFCGYCHGSNGK